MFNNPKRIVGIIQQDEVGEKFLLYYPLPDDKDLVVVIKARQAKSKLYLTLITAYLQEKRRRMKTNEK